MIKHPIIVLEGADGTGKTTLAKKLVEMYRGYYIHNRRHRDVWPYHLASIRQALKFARLGPVIIDRHWLSECVYGTVYRGGIQARYDERALHRVLARFGVTYVLAAPAPEVAVGIHGRMKAIRPEMFDDITRVAEMYHNLWHGFENNGALLSNLTGSYLEQLMLKGVKDKLNWLLYDITEHPGEVGVVKAAQVVMKHARERLAEAWQPGLDPKLWNLTGVVKPGNVLLVGDQLSDKETPVPWPFFAAGGSSKYLSKTLSMLRIDEDRICMVNANAGDDALHHIADAAKICGKVVALGREAEAGLKELDVQYHHAIRHPQHARRFTHHKRSYVDELEQAIDPTADARL